MSKLKAAARIGALVLVSMLLSAAAVAQPRTTEVILTACGGIWINNYCVENPTPAQRAKAEDDARRAREKQAAEERAEQLRRAEHKRKVDAEVARLGEHRRAEAERLVNMRDKAEGARPKPNLNTCKDKRQFAKNAWGEGPTQADAMVKFVQSATLACSTKMDGIGPYDARNITCAPEPNRHKSTIICGSWITCREYFYCADGSQVSSQ